MVCWQGKKGGRKQPETCLQKSHPRKRLKFRAKNLPNNSESFTFHETFFPGNTDCRQEAARKSGLIGFVEIFVTYIGPDRRSKDQFGVVAVVEHDQVAEPGETVGQQNELVAADIELLQVG